MSDLDFPSNQSIIGESQEIREVLKISERVAKSDSSVFIYGESGTGKESLAKFIHDNSNRKYNKFITINCAAIPDELLENELFGHKKGAFTDANDDYTGKFAFADKGTIFLDEISEISFNLQAKLLRILQNKEYEPLGSTVTFKSDVRIISATNKDILKQIQDKKFRLDLYYRLNVVPINLPPLRNRENDIELLAKYFLKLYNAKNNKNIKGFSDEILKSFYKYNWPGNIRELQNVIERSVVLCSDNIINKNNLNISNDFLLNKDNSSFKNLKDAINDFKKTYIIEVLLKNDWNQTKSAKVLDIQRSYLARLIKELNIYKK